MSLSVTQFPQDNDIFNRYFSPAYNEMIFVVHESSSGTLASPNFRYICKIYDVTNAILLATLKTFPLVDGYGVFDTHRILESFVNEDNQYDIKYNDSNIKECTNSHFLYIVRFGEEYGAPPNEHMLLNDNLARGVFNAIYDFPDFAAFYPGGVDVTINDSGKYLTNRPLVQNIRKNESAWLQWAEHLNPPVNPFVHMELICYDAAGNITFQDDTTITSPGAATSIFRCAVGPHDLNALGIMSSYPAYYTLQAVQSFTSLGHVFYTPYGDIYQFNLICPDPKYTPFRLHFLNKLGAFDSFTFSKKSHQKGDTERQAYKKVTGSESSGSWSYQSSDRQVTVFDTKVKTKYSIESDWVTDAEYQWLKELITSPVVLYQESGGMPFIPVNIETNSFEIKKKQNEKLINLALEVSLSYDEYRQRG